MCRLAGWVHLSSRVETAYKAAWRFERDSVMPAPIQPGPRRPDPTQADLPADLPTWPLHSGEDLAGRGDVIVAWYEAELARDDFASGKTFGSELGEVDKQVIDGLAKSGRNDCLVRVAQAAFIQALHRFEGSGASTARGRKYTDEQRDHLTLELERSCRRASFGLDWCKEVASASAEWRRELRSILEDQKLAPYFYFLGWLDVAGGCEVVGIDWHYEFMAASIRLRRSKLLTP
jgi:hypothetical protein